MVYCFMSSLGEMASYLPITGSINAYGTRFFDPALGFMLGRFLFLMPVIGAQIGEKRSILRE